MDFKEIKTNTPSWTHQPKFLLPFFNRSTDMTKLFSQTIFRNLNSIYKKYLIKRIPNDTSKS